MDLDGIGELLSKEQMKMVTGGDDYNLYIRCVMDRYNHASGQHEGSEIWGYYHTSYSTECGWFCSMQGASHAYIEWRGNPEGCDTSII